MYEMYPDVYSPEGYEAVDEALARVGMAQWLTELFPTLREHIRRYGADYDEVPPFPVEMITLLDVTDNGFTLDAFDTEGRIVRYSFCSWYDPGHREQPPDYGEEMTWKVL